MNSEAQVIAARAARAACKGKTFASDPDAFKELEAAKVRRNIARDPLFYAHKYQAETAKRRVRQAG